MKKLNELNVRNLNEAGMNLIRGGGIGDADKPADESKD